MWHEVPLCQSHGVIRLYGPPHNSTLYCVAFDAAFHDKVTSVLRGREAPLGGLFNEGAAGAEGGGVGVTEGVGVIVSVGVGVSVGPRMVNVHVSLQSLS